MTEPSHAVFLSYASQDAEAAQKICEALRAAGIEVWFDQSELRGGDAWDQSIRKQIKTCALFIPVISHATHDRREGYFRLEWKLAVDRSHLMDAEMAFLLPVVVDDTRDDDERVPERFREVQWTRLPGGVTPEAFVERVRRLLSGEPSPEPKRAAPAAARAAAAPTIPKPVPASRGSKPALLATIAVVVVTLGYLIANRLVFSKRGAEAGAILGSTAQSAPAAAFNPPPHSIAVLPFANMSGDKEQDYFSDGLSEELLNALSRVGELQVAARTSSFYFKGKDVDLGTVARKLNVAAVLEGSVRRSAHTVRVTTQLIDSVSGFHLWSDTYDRDLGDVLALESEIATSVASALKVTLLGDVAAKAELGGTRNPEAYDAYLRAWRAFATAHELGDMQRCFTEFTQAIRLDPNYALAFTGRSRAYEYFSRTWATIKGQDMRGAVDKALADARRAIALAPDLGEAHAALAVVLEEGFFDFTHAAEEYQQALKLAPGNARVLRTYASFASAMGNDDAAVAAARRALALDRMNEGSYASLATALGSARRYDEAIAAYKEALIVDPNSWFSHAYLGMVHYKRGDFESARTSCEINVDLTPVQHCLALAYHRLGRQADAKAMLARIYSVVGDAEAYTYAETYAQWGNAAKALEWLETAMRRHDPNLEGLKTDGLMDPLRGQPRFQAIEREMKFPD